MTAFHDGADQEAGLAATRTALQKPPGSGDMRKGSAIWPQCGQTKPSGQTGAPKIGSTCRVIGNNC